MEPMNLELLFLFKLQMASKLELQYILNVTMFYSKI